MQAKRVALTTSFLGLFGFAGLFANYGAKASASFDIKTENESNLPNSVTTLLTRNLNDVFGENDPVRRRKAVGEIFTQDAVFYDPKGGVYRGRDEIDRIAGELRVMHHDFRYQPIGEPEEVGNGGRVRWTEGRPGEAPAVAGTDFIVTRDGGLPLFIFFSTSYADLNWDVLRHTKMSRNDELVAVVTGGSRGIGKGVARALAERGSTVYIAGRSQAGGIYASPD